MQEPELRRQLAVSSVGLNSRSHISEPAASGSAERSGSPHSVGTVRIQPPLPVAGDASAQESATTAARLVNPPVAYVSAVSVSSPRPAVAPAAGAVQSSSCQQNESQIRRGAPSHNAGSTKGGQGEQDGDGNSFLGAAAGQSIAWDYYSTTEPLNAAPVTAPAKLSAAGGQRRRHGRSNSGLAQPTAADQALVADTVSRVFDTSDGVAATGAFP